MPDGKTAVLVINGAALPHTITIDVDTVLGPDAVRQGGVSNGKTANITNIWSGKTLGKDVTELTQAVRPHASVFVMLH
jgi:hypothetical protein